MSQDATALLKFEQFEPSFDIFFWKAVIDKKLNEWKLHSGPVEIYAHYSSGRASRVTETGKQRNQPSYYNFGRHSFGFEPIPRDSVNCKGTLINTNTIEEFKKLDFNASFDAQLQELWSCIIALGGSAKSVWGDPSLLTRHLVVMFANIKKHTFVYMVAIPALQLPSPAVLTKRESFHISEELRQLISATSSSFFVLRSGAVHALKILKDGGIQQDDIIGFIDPSSSDDSVGWPLRNLLVFLKHHFDISSLRILSYRKEGSTLLHVELPGGRVLSCPKGTGWIRDSDGKLSPQKVDLSSTMDPVAMADATVDLNLKLMKWRIMPELELDAIMNLKVLLLGAGTLGCNVARILMGWGVKTMTFVDNGTVSYSNVSRQPLFQFKDYGKSKALAAAENLKLILPSLSVKGVNLTIPMPGHFPTTNTEKDYRDLDDLVKEHDVVFLLTDSREARWLPTALGVLHNKPLINVALGFDSFLVMRHPVVDHEGKKNIGCYFCNDIVAPTDSLADRTLDQQCTVTRPGIATIASGYGVELLTSMLQHPLKALAPPEAESTLGSIPHQIRGYVSDFKNMIISGKAYEKCTACADVIISVLKSDGYLFVKKVLEDAKFLEVLTGLDKLHLETEQLNIEALSDFEDEI